MSRSKKHNNSLKDFLRYSGKEMKGKERNAFEKKLQKDAFEAEAAEGFSMVSTDDARNDLNEISQRLNKRKRTKLTVSFLRIAAVVTLLLATAIILRIVTINEKQPLISESITPISEKNPIIIPASEGIQMASEESRRPEPVGRTTDQVTTRYIAPVVIETASVSELALAEDVAHLEEIERAEEDKEAEIIAQVMPSLAKKETQRKRKIEGTVISTEDNQPIPGVSVVIKGTTRGTVSDINGKFSLDIDTDSSLKLVANSIGMTTQEVISKPDTDLLIAMNESVMALDEVVVVGYGTAKSKSAFKGETIYEAEDNNTNNYIPPVPETGNTEFRNYIDLNLRYPSEMTERIKQVVILSITVRSTGTVDNITIVKSPGKAFSDEAIRLIKEGPGWKPSTLNGQPQDEEVKLRIVFK